MRETLATRREEVRLRLFALALDEIAHGICREPGRGGAESRTGSADGFDSNRITIASSVRAGRVLSANRDFTEKLGQY